MGNADELWAEMIELFEEWMTTMMQDMIEDYDWTNDDMTASNIISKLHNIMGEAGLPQFYATYHSSRHDTSFHDWALEWAAATMESLGY